jgi:hypothetical protein
MKIVDRIQDKDLIILKVLFDKWKETHQGKLAYDAEFYEDASIQYATKIPKDSFRSHLENLERIDFVSLENDQVKLLPSGINYCLGQFDKMRH